MKSKTEFSLDPLVTSLIDSYMEQGFSVANVSLQRVSSFFPREAILMQLSLERNLHQLPIGPTTTESGSPQESQSSSSKPKKSYCHAKLRLLSPSATYPSGSVWEDGALVTGGAVRSVATSARSCPRTLLPLYSESGTGDRTLLGTLSVELEFFEVD